MLERILKLMEEKGLNKNQLAQRTGLPRTTIYSALASEESCQKAKLETIRPIAKALGTTLDYIISGNEEKKEAKNRVVIYTEYGAPMGFDLSPQTIEVLKLMLDQLVTGNF